MEEWRTIAADPQYEISSAGRIRRGDTGSLRKSTLTGRYYTIRLRGNAKRHLTHRLVAEAFLGPAPAGHVVNHINGDSTDNSLGNLEYVTPSENMQHARRMGLFIQTRGERHGSAKLCETDALAIRLRANEGEQYAVIAQSFSVHPSVVSDICRGRLWRHVGGPLQHPRRKGSGRSTPGRPSAAA